VTLVGAPAHLAVAIWVRQRTEEIFDRVYVGSHPSPGKGDLPVTGFSYNPDHFHPT